MNERGLYEVVWPLGKSAFEPLPVKDRLPDLTNKTIAFMWDYAFEGDRVWAIVKESLAERYEGAKFIDHKVFGNIHGQDERALVAAIPDKLRELGVDAVITGVGA